MALFDKSEPAPNPDEHKGVTRKSAASAKPTREKAAGVRITSSSSAGKTPEQKKAAAKARQKAEREQARAEEQKFSNPPTEEYSRWKKVWWGLLIGAVALTVLSWFGREVIPEPFSWVILGLAYASIIGALVVDLGKMRKLRNAYRQSIEAGPKGYGQMTKAEKAAARAEQTKKNQMEKQQRLQAGDQAEPEPEAEEEPVEKKKSLLDRFKK